MRIYDANSDKILKNITLYLTEDEAEEMKDSLEDLLVNKNHHHAHIPDETFKREITICIYRKDNLSVFDDHSKTLILGDE